MLEGAVMSYWRYPGDESIKVHTPVIYSGIQMILMLCNISRKVLMLMTEILLQYTFLLINMICDLYFKKGIKVKSILSFDQSI